MDAQKFLAEFGHIANAPGGVQQLRNMVYQLAITGALTPQLDTDENARHLLANITALKERLIREKAYKRQPKLEGAALSIPKFISLPESWCWTRLLDLGEISPKNIAQDETSASFIPMSGFSELHKGQLISEVSKWRKMKKGFTHFRNGDVVIAKITPCFENGKAAVIHDLEHAIGAGTTELHVFRPIHTGVLPEYIYLFLRSPYFTVEGEKNMTGTAGQKRLPTEYFATHVLPLPPTAEQSRIVAKVDELMALCDKLEAQQQESRKLQNSLRQSTLQAIANASSPYELQTTWVRLADSFGQLFYAPEDVTYLRNLILDLGTNGYLSEPQVEDSNPIEMLMRANLQQKAEFSPKELREINALPELSHENGRTRIALGHVVKLVSGQHLTPDEYNNRQDGIPYITGPAEFKSRRPDPSKWTNMRKAVARAGDILITVKGSGVGKTALCDLEELAISRQLMAIRALADLDQRYLSICIDSAERSFQEQKFGIAIPGIGRAEVLSLFILLPSIEEQGRIINRIDELMRLCDSLELQLRYSKKTAEQIAIATVSSLTGITTKQKEEPMKAPQTELISPLRIGQTPDIKAQAPLATILARHNGEMSAKDLWQRFSGEIDAFYSQLKTEVAYGWILEPSVAEVREKQTEAASL